MIYKLTVTTKWADSRAEGGVGWNISTSPDLSLAEIAHDLRRGVDFNQDNAADKQLQWAMQWWRIADAIEAGYRSGEYSITHLTPSVEVSWKIKPVRRFGRAV